MRPSLPNDRLAAFGEKREIPWAGGASSSENERGRSSVAAADGLRLLTMGERKTSESD